MTARDFIRQHWLAVAMALVALAILIAVIMLMRTLPPRTITMATGPEGGAYHEVGKFYRTILAGSGVELGCGRPERWRISRCCAIPAPGWTSRSSRAARPATRRR